MAFDIIYKGELNGTQVDFQTGSLTDISTFDTDVRASAIENSIGTSTTRGASQQAIRTMSGVIASSAHPSVSAGTSISEDNDQGNVIQDLTITIDDTGHVTATSIGMVDLDDRYFTESEINTRFNNTGSIIDQNRNDIDTLSGLITSNDGELTQLFAESDSLSGSISQAESDIDALSGLIDQSEADIDTLSGLIDTAEADIVDLSGTMNALTLDDICENGGTTDVDIQVNDIRVDGGSITGPATITIDPDSAGAAGTVVIQGDLQVEGTTTTINSSTVELGDLNLTLGTGAGNDAALDGGGIQLSGTHGLAAEFVYDATNDRWKTNNLDIEADIVGAATGADAWTSARTITLGGDLGGNVSIDGSANATLTATIQAGSVENSMLAGSIANGKLSNSSVTVTAGSGLVGGGSVSLGGTTTLNIATNDGISVSGDGIGLNYNTNDFDIGSSEELRIKDGGVSSAKLASSSVTAAKIANDAVTSGKIADDAVVSDHIADGAVVTAAIASAAVNTSKLGDLVVSTAKIANSAVTTAKIANDAVTSDKLGSSVAGDNITFTDGVLSVADSDIRAAITGGASTIASSNLTASRALVSNGSGKVAVSAVTSTELGYLDGVSSNIQTQLNGKVATTRQVASGDGLTGGGDLSANRTLSTVADQGHLDEIELGSDNTAVSNVVTKGGILILRGTDNNGITTSGSDGNAIDLNDKTTVAFEGVVQSADTAQDSDNGSYVAMWKIQGVIRRDSDSTNMLQSFVTKTFAGSNASSYGLSVSVSSNGLKINSDQTTATLITSATINYNWIEDAS